MSRILPSAMNTADVALEVAALQRLVGLPLSSAWQPTRTRLVLGFADGTLLLLVPRGIARLHTVVRRPQNPPRPFSFQGACRARLTGPLQALSQVGEDRAVELVFGEHRLHLRMTGRTGGLWLFEGERLIASLDGPAAGLPVLPEPARRPVTPSFVPAEGEDFDAAARRIFARVEANQRRTDLRARVERTLRTALSRTRRLASRLDEDLTRAAEAPELRAQADALAIALHRVPRGAERAVVEDPMEPGKVYTIALDPDRAPSESLSRLYARAARMDRAGDRILERIDESEKTLAALEGALAAVATADEDTLKGWEARFGPLAAPRAAAAAEGPIATWVGPRGETVMVGRNEKGNRQLTFNVGRAHEVWMHLRDRPGAHVLVRVARGHTAPLELLLAAAQITLAQAKVPHGAAAEVQYTAIRNVRSIPGSGPGHVRLAQEKVLNVTRDPNGLVGWTRI